MLNVNRQYLLCVLRPEVCMKCEQRLVDLKIEQSGKPTSEKMTSHGSVSDLPADIVRVDRVLIRLVLGMLEQQRRRPACISAQTDQPLCYLHFGKDHI